MSRPLPSRFIPLTLLILLCELAAQGANAQVKLGSPFGEHMVLPSGVPVEIWGEGCPGGDTLKVAIAGQSVTTRSDWGGHWLLRLAPMKPGGPYQMNIQIGGTGPLVVSSAANDHGGAEINDVMIGKVIAMQASSDQANDVPQDTVEARTHPYARIRVYQSASAGSAGQWLYVSQGEPPSGTKAFFRAGHQITQETHFPVGITIIAPPPAPPRGATFPTNR